MPTDAFVKSVSKSDSVEKKLYSANEQISKMTQTIDDQAQKLADLEQQLKKELFEKQEIQRDYRHVVELFQELRVN